MNLTVRLLRAFVACPMFYAGGLHSLFSSPVAAQSSIARRDDTSSSRPGTMFTPNLNRTIEHRQTPPEDRHPIQQLAVNRDTYFKWLQFSQHFQYADNPDGHGPYAPRHFMLVIAHYVQSGEQKHGRACITMLQSFRRWIRAEVAKKGWHALFCEEIGYIGLYRKYLVAGGLLKNDEPWLRDLILDFAKGIHPWDSPLSYLARPGGFRDFAANDTNYFSTTLKPLFLRAALLGDTKFFADPQMSPAWSRLIHEVSPDGGVVPYGANCGWNDTAGMRIAMLEILATHTGDGRYRYVAHRLMNYLVYQRNQYRAQHLLLGPQTTEPLALASLFADHKIQPVEPDSGSMVLYRKETIRLPGYGVGPRDKTLAEPIIGPVDARKDRGFGDCGLLINENRKPSKLVLRSGWKPGDFYVLVDLFPAATRDRFSTLHQSASCSTMTAQRSCASKGPAAGSNGRLSIHPAWQSKPAISRRSLGQLTWIWFPENKLWRGATMAWRSSSDRENCRLRM